MPANISGAAYRIAFFVVAHHCALPTHVTADEMREKLGEDISALHKHFSEVNELLLSECNFWLEAVLCPATATAPATSYFTIYHEEQDSCLSLAREPGAGPYFIPDHLRW
jgi:hypothetical protein